MARFSTIEASPVFDIDFRLRAFLPCVPFLKAVWARGVRFASGWPFALKPLRIPAFLRLLVREPAPHESTKLFIVRGAVFDESCQFSTEHRFCIIRALVPLVAFEEVVSAIRRVAPL